MLGLVGFLIAAGAGLVRHLGARAAAGEGDRPPLISSGIALALALAVATGAFELLILVVTGNDLLGARNLVTVLGRPRAADRRRARLGRADRGGIATALVIACFGIGAFMTLETENELIGLQVGGRLHRAEIGPDDVVVDLALDRRYPGAADTAGCLPAQARPEYRILLPEDEPPFLPYEPIPPSVRAR